MLPLIQILSVLFFLAQETAENSGMSFDSLIHMVIEAGFAVALVIFFVLQSDKREKKMQATVEQMAAFQRETLMSLVVNSTEAIQNNAAAIREFREDISEMTSVIAHKKTDHA
jgi:ABC-type Mn2+/Zn2+ transport system permease subunit